MEAVSSGFIVLSRVCTLVLAYIRLMPSDSPASWLLLLSVFHPGLLL